MEIVRKSLWICLGNRLFLFLCLDLGAPAHLGVRSLKDVASGESDVSCCTRSWDERGRESDGCTDGLRITEGLFEIFELDDVGEFDEDVEVGVFVDVEFVCECSDD